MPDTKLFDSKDQLYEPSKRTKNIKKAMDATTEDLRSTNTRRSVVAQHKLDLARGRAAFLRLGRLARTAVSCWR